MPTFATLEQRASRAAINRASNASAVWFAGGEGVGTPVPGIRIVFDRETDTAMGMVNDGNPVASVFASDMPGAKRGDAVLITPDPVGAVVPPSAMFNIKNARPDGAGLLVIHLHGEAAR